MIIMNEKQKSRASALLFVFIEESCHLRKQVSCAGKCQLLIVSAVINYLFEVINQMQF